MTDESIEVTRIERQILEALERIEQPVRSQDMGLDLASQIVGRAADRLAKQQLVNRHKHGGSNSWYWTISDLGRQAISHLKVRPPETRRHPSPPPQVPATIDRVPAPTERSSRVMVFGEGALEQLADILIGKVLPEDPKELRDRNAAQSKTIADLQGQVKRLETDLEAAVLLLTEQAEQLRVIRSALKSSI